MSKVKTPGEVFDRVCLVQYGQFQAEKSRDIETDMLFQVILPSQRWRVQPQWHRSDAHSPTICILDSILLYYAVGKTF